MKPDKLSSKERIEHVLNAIRLIQSFSENHTRQSFLKDEKTIYACLYQYTIIGEAVAHIDYSILEKYTYPWYKVKSFRNFILHEYHAIDMKVIWDTTTEILPGLKNLMEEICKNE